MNARIVIMLLYPIFFIREELESIVVGKHAARSMFRIIFTVLGCLISSILLYNSTRFVHFLNDIIKAFEVPTTVQPAMSLYFSMLFSGSLSVFCSRMITKAFCYFRFGDPDFYLTKKREGELVEVFRHQGYNVTGYTIRKVIEFCLHNFHKRHSHEFGLHQHDWKRVLDSLIYDGDLETFLEQQELLQKKLRKTTQRCNALTKYGSAVDLEKSLLWSFKNQTKFNCEEEQPLLPRQVSQNADTIPLSISANSLTALNREVREKMMVVKVLSKFKQHNKHHKHHELLHHCANHLRKQEQYLTDVIFPLQFSPTSTTTTPSSGGSDTVYDPDAIAYSFSYSNPSALRPTQGL